MITYIPSNASKLVHTGVIKLRRILMHKEYHEDHFAMLLLEELQQLRDFEHSMCSSMAEIESRLKVLKDCSDHKSDNTYHRYLLPLVFMPQLHP